MITLIAACSSNRVIGKDNSLIWHLPDDLKRFKQITTNQVVIMGRKTFQAIGRPLPKRTNVILTRDRSFKAEGCFVYNNIEDVLSLFHDYIVIGGSDIYRQFIGIADIIELTLLDKEFDGDSFFPEISSSFVETNRETKNNGEFDYHFITYKRK
jgi:dihydrofolate reductase